MRFWNFAVDENEPEKIELRIEGDIISDDDAWFYEWLGIKGTSPNTFREELKKYEGKDITVWIDSYGGDVFAAAGIYNALMEHKGKITVKVDGKAMSAASVIAMAGGEILMSPVAIMMIHNPWMVVAGDMQEMRHQADVLDSIKDALINAYQLKTGRARNKISQMMDDETYMSAKTAIKEGFADGMLYSTKEMPEDVAALAFNRHSVMNAADAGIKRFCELKQKLKPEEPPKPEEPENETELAIAKLNLELAM